MNCPSCGSPNREGRRFCGSCGAPLAQLCGGCGAANEADEKFCGQCGTALTATAAAVPRPIPAPPGSAASVGSSERRHVTVLFADLVGFMSLSGQRDAEDVRELLSRYFDTARTVITRYGGTVEKFIGDAVMAVWGAPTIQEDDAERAVRAALELVDAVAAFGEEVGAIGLRARAGVLTGEAAVSVGAVEQGLIAGDLVNIASRVQSAAEPGMVYVGDATRQATEAAIVYEDVGTHQLKGKVEAVRLWRARRVAAGRGGAMRVTGLEPPFVGRDRELRLLKEYLHGTAEEGKARLLSIVGIGGVGKSRLGWEFFKYIDGQIEVVHWHRGRCLAYGEGVAYWALNEMVRMRAGIIENEAPDSARAKLRSTVEEFVTDPEERRWVEPRLAHLIGLEDRVATDPRDLYAAWRFFFERLAVKHLTVLLFEDLQWADSGLLDFIEYLLEWSRTSPLLVVTLARPELTEKRPGWAAGKRGVTALYLEPLSPDAMDRLLEGMVPGLPADLKERVRERAAGVPLYAVETVRMLLDRGLLIEEGGTYRAEGSLESLEVPESLHALIAARLDSLQPQERQILQDASVLGKAFSTGALRAISTVPGDTVDAVLSGLVSKDLLAIQSDPRSPERGQYVFLQDLVRDVAYGTLARRDRKLRHLAAATYLESAWSWEEEVAEVVASHFVEAYDADREADDAVEIRSRARDALVKAGDHAASLAAASSAQHYYERALQLAEDADRAALHALAGQMAWLQLNVAASRAHFDEAEAMHTAAGRTGAAARVSVRLAGLDVHELKAESALARVERAFSSLSDQDTTGPEREADLAIVAAELGRRLVLLRGSTDVALERVELALDIAERRGLWETFCEAINTKGLILGGRGRYAEAMALVECALEHALAFNLHDAALRAYNNVAARCQATDLVRAQSLSQDGAAMARLVGDRRNEIALTVGQVPILVDLGRWDEAIHIATDYDGIAGGDLAESDVASEMIYGVWVHIWRDEIAAAKRLRDRLSFVFEQHITAEYSYLTRAVDAALLRADGRNADAFDLMSRVLSESRGSAVDLYVGRWVLHEGADAAFALGEMTAVRLWLDSITNRVRRGLGPALDAAVSMISARLAAAEARDADVSAHAREAADLFDKMRMPFWKAVTQLEHGEWLIAQARAPEAEEMLAQATAAFADLGAAPWLERVNTARGSAQPAPREAPAAMPA
ncbi:MAG TPA: adenylate/guanylate cyclase domain-containing protein [Candidatus Dormibacteraeota bacterium]